MEWIAANWFLLLLLGGCLGMHFFMHGRGHGHGGHEHHHTEDAPQNKLDNEEKPAPEFGPIKEQSDQIPE